MTANETRPAGAGSEADGPEPILPDSHRQTLIGAPLEKPIDATLWRLVKREIGLQDVTPALAAWYSIGYHDGIASCRARIEHLEHEADVLYVRAFNPSDRAKIIEARMREGAEEYWAKFVVGDAL